METEKIEMMLEMVLDLVEDATTLAEAKRMSQMIKNQFKKHKQQSTIIRYEEMVGLARTKKTNLKEVSN